MLPLRGYLILHLILICNLGSKTTAQKDCNDFLSISRAKTRYCDNHLISTLYQQIEDVKSTHKYLEHKFNLFTEIEQKTCNKNKSALRDIKNRVFRSCRTAIKYGNGAYFISSPKPNSEPIRVYCMKDPDHGEGWTVIQRRVNEFLSFNRNWTSYENGFGDVSSNFWLGLKKLFYLTTSQPHELLIQMKSTQNYSYYVKYDHFAIGHPDSKYGLEILGKYKGEAGNALYTHQGAQFSTIDQFNEDGNECGKQSGSGWWFPKACGKCNLNGHYVKDFIAGEINKKDGIFWGASRYTTRFMIYSQMAIRQLYSDFCT